MTITPTYRDYPIVGSFVILEDTDLGRVPVLSTPDLSDVMEWVWEVQDRNGDRQSQRTHVFVLENWGERRDITEDVAADLADAFFERQGDYDTDESDFPDFAQWWASDHIRDLLIEQREAEAAAVDQRSSYYASVR